ncbi:MAG TPA: hypothetical protein VGM06_13290 [Polyangiaceae bacterium]|jgi:hypothetical protein
MKSLDEIAAEATEANVRLRVNTEVLSRVSGAMVDGLFHTPLLAITILVIARARRSGLQTADLATWTLGTLVRHFDALRLARGRIQWSVLLRRRCADALVFLENVGLASVVEGPMRTVHISANGRDFVAKLSRSADEAGVLVRQLQRAHRAVEQGGLELI